MQASIQWDAVAGIDLASKKRVGLVCSGGAVKAAAFHVGVAMALEHQGFEFAGGTVGSRVDEAAASPSKSIQVYVGSSAGCLVATFLAQGGKLSDIVGSFLNESTGDGIPGLKVWQMLSPRMRSKFDFLSFDNFLLSMFRKRVVQSPFTTQGIANYLKSHVLATERFHELTSDLFIVTTELNQSKKVIFSRYKAGPAQPTIEYRNDVAISDACAASMALPPIYHPYTLQIDGERRDFFDGEIREPLSSHVARDMGCDLIICSYTHQPIRLPNSQGSLADRGLQQVVLQAIYQAIEQKIQSARSKRTEEKALIDTVARFFKDKNLSPMLCDELVGEIEARMTYKANLDYVYIRPKPSDIDMFLAPHFSLKRKTTERIVKKGFLAAIQALRGLKTGLG
jgi:predicted acylesterase/phospholipase RssA